MNKLALAAVAAVASFSPSAIAQAPAADEGPVTRAQFEQTNKERFQAMDANKDGFVTPDELGAAIGAEGAQRMIGRLDGNEDGKVSLAELNTRMLAMFDRADANHDGTVTPEERSAAREAMRARRQGNP